MADCLIALVFILHSHQGPGTEQLHVRRHLELTGTVVAHIKRVECTKTLWCLPEPLAIITVSLISNSMRKSGKKRWRVRWGRELCGLGERLRPSLVLVVKSSAPFHMLFTSQGAPWSEGNLCIRVVYSSFAFTFTLSSLKLHLHKS